LTERAVKDKTPDWITIREHFDGLERMLKGPISYTAVYGQAERRSCSMGDSWIHRPDGGCQTDLSSDKDGEESEEVERRETKARRKNRDRKLSALKLKAREKRVPAPPPGSPPAVTREPGTKGNFHDTAVATLPEDDERGRAGDWVCPDCAHVNWSNDRGDYEQEFCTDAFRHQGKERTCGHARWVWDDEATDVVKAPVCVKGIEIELPQRARRRQEARDKRAAGEIA
jgi:hypothetical protein